MSSGEANKNQEEIPEEVLKILSSSDIGYLAVTSGKGTLYSYPVAFYYNDYKVYFMTPISAAKLRFMKANSAVSFLVDNHLVTKGAIGAMMQGRAKVFSVGKTVLSILSVGPNMARFARKYPGMFTFYAKGKDLPDERKLYKYRLIRIDSTKILYWIGYKMAKYTPKKSAKDPLSQASDDAKMETLANLMEKADEELPVVESPKGAEIVGNLDASAKSGPITDYERAVIGSYRNMVRRMTDSTKVGPEVTSDEKKLLRRWKGNAGK